MLVKYLAPKGAGRRATEAVVLLLAISYGARLIILWLAPVIPLLISVAVLLAIWGLIFGRRQ